MSFVVTLYSLCMLVKCPISIIAYFQRIKSQNSIIAQCNANQYRSIMVKIQACRSHVPSECNRAFTTSVWSHLQATCSAVYFSYMLVGFVKIFLQYFWCKINRAYRGSAFCIPSLSHCCGECNRAFTISVWPP